MRRLTCMLAVLALPLLVAAGTTVSEVAPYSWGPNIGWIDWRGGGADGADFGAPRVASGYIYSANIGWIHLGDGTPKDGNAYGNDSAEDYGVNLDLMTDPGYILLSGYAYSANAGWIAFDKSDTANRPKIDRKTGKLVGFVYGANIGWLPLDAGANGVVTAIPPSGADGFTIF